ncbi:hypothetical protein TYRP_020642 [Tyrophagus putrescentiae]|nr:hypothetical protein TYRP_020642 [Tyrophagus putrescentiae]
MSSSSRTTESLSSLSSPQQPKIAIIGAGIAGLSAARALFAGGLQNLTIFEAANRIGGRIHTVPFGDHHLELGAQWLHGQQDNVLYRFAEEHQLLPADPVAECGVQGAGAWLRDDDGLEIEDGGREEALVLTLIAWLDASKAALGERINGGKEEDEEEEVEPVKKKNMFEYFSAALDRFIAFEGPLAERDVRLCKMVFRWFILFEVIDNAAAEGDLRQISHLSYSEYEECEGVVELVNLQHGYGSLLRALVKGLPLEDDNFLRLKTAVRRVEPLMMKMSSCDGGKQARAKVKLLTRKLSYDVELEEELAKDFEALDDDEEDEEKEDEEEHLFDHVILTSSLGFLKEQLQLEEKKSRSFFGFCLPPEKTALITALGFGTIAKIFLHFERPFWREGERGFQVLWTPRSSQFGDQHSYEEDENSFWLRSIQSFDAVRGQPHLLMAWVGSPGAEAVERMSKGRIARACGRLLRRIVPSSRLKTPSEETVIEDPSAVVCSRWHSHPFIRGAYSNRTVAYEQLSGAAFDGAGAGVDLLAKPVTVGDLFSSSSADADADDDDDTDRPLVLFAGEATDRTHYSTTDGAARSGAREAARLLSLYDCQGKKS